MGPRERVSAAAGRLLRTLNRRWAPWLHRGMGSPPPAVAMYCVYRDDNAEHVHALLRQLPEGSASHLHALGDPAPILQGHTRSQGAGSRMPLLGALIDRFPPAPGQYVLLADDDVEFAGRWGDRFPGLAQAAGLDLAMPAHDTGSAHTFRVTEQRPSSTLRLTDFVEVGPLLLVSPRAIARVFPFPPDARMGWGLDVAWSGLAAEGLRLGVVDATPMFHFGSVGAAYDMDYERAQLTHYCQQAGVDSAYDLAQNAGAVWRPWQRRPTWTAGPEEVRADH